MGRPREIAELGTKFGRLSLIENLPAKNGHAMVRCICECDGQKEWIGLLHTLKLGLVKSCGCLQKENCSNVGKNNITHGMEGTKLYKVWHNMIQRCENPNFVRYKDWGGRGIKVCQEWHKFDEFLKWANSSGYKEGLQIDRIDNDGSYTPLNCRWVTVKENCLNRRNNISVADKK